MRSFAYPAVFEPAGPEEAGGFAVFFRDVPEAITQGDDFEDAKEYALDALITSVDFYKEMGLPFPEPSLPKPDEVLIELPYSIGVKIALLNLMIKAKIRPAELARKMNLMPQQINRLLSLRHKTKIDTIEQAFNVLGYKIGLELEPAATA